MAEPYVPTLNKSQAAQRRLFESQGVSLFEPGGFARRDKLRESAQAGVIQERKNRRMLNLAYRDALRRNDRAGAAQIALNANAQGLQLGGVEKEGVAMDRSVTNLQEQEALRQAGNGGEQKQDAAGAAAGAVQAAAQGIQLGLGGAVQQQAAKDGGNPAPQAGGVNPNATPGAGRGKPVSNKKKAKQEPEDEEPKEKDPKIEMSPYTAPDTSAVDQESLSKLDVTGSGTLEAIRQGRPRFTLFDGPTLFG